MYRLSFLFLSLFILSVTSCQKKDIPGLVAYYSFSGNANDESGNGNHGVVYGAHSARDRFGNENNAYNFDGISAYIQAIVSNMPAVESSQTISLWFMVDQQPSFKESLGADNIIALVDSAAGTGVQFGYRAAGYQTLGFDTWYWGGELVLESPHPSVNAWHHCVYTYDSQTHLFYLDGKQTAKSLVKPQLGMPKMLMLGNYPGGDQFFHGSLDEVRIYNRALSPSEINLLFTKKE
jgi:hypothetical protein